MRLRFCVGMEYGRNSIDDESAFKTPSCKSGDILGAYGAR